MQGGILRKHEFFLSRMQIYILFSEKCFKQEEFYMSFL